MTNVVIHIPVVQTLIRQIEDGADSTTALAQKLLHRTISGPLDALPGTVTDVDSLLRQALDYALRSIDEREMAIGKQAHSLAGRYDQCASELTGYLARAKQLDRDGTDAVIALDAAQSQQLQPAKIAPTWTESMLQP